ncbi:Signal recognition particle receptor subunit alpha homolog [Linum grandiflorum]
MLEQLLIFTRGGLILWTCNQLGNALKGLPIDTLIRSCLLEERSGAQSYNYDAPGHKKDNGHSNGHHVQSDGSRGLSVVNGKENASDNVGAFDVSKLQQIKNKGGKKTDTIVGNNKGLKVDPKKKVTKKNRIWDDSPVQSKLDFTDPAENGNENRQVVAANQGESMMDKEEIVSSESEDEEDEVGKDSRPDSNKKGWFSSMFQSIAGKANFEKSDLEPALKALKDRLMTKNVAEEIAEKLCESVAASLEGKKLGSFTRISSTVQAAMEDALVRILTPKRSIDILRDVHAAKEQRKPYVVVFVGVNGVGKSTNLAKIPIFEKGYEKDPAVVAKEAIQEATRNGSDVVLVDTAGRMQKLADLSASPNPQLIDGILLTKFDTIDDKVGAALSMVYISGAPVMFVGCGQSYTDLKKLNVKSIVKTLLK